MQTYDCQCGSMLFFESTKCLNCKCETGMCSTCRKVVSIDQQNQSTWLCGNSECQLKVQRCGNFRPNLICNRLIPATDDPDSLCDYCEMTTVIPDLNVEGNIEKWRRLELAKQRVLFQLDQIGLPFRQTSVQNSMLSFEFKADDNMLVPTGHNQGQIVINIKEADSVQRERSRVQFGEPQRTLLGHFRHELGHFFWDRLVNRNPANLKLFRNLFGNEANPIYDIALQSYYQNGPTQNWQASFVSAYATMHPWEDFAETFATYLDIRSVVANANHFLSSNVATNDFEALVKCHCDVGIMANEFNRDMGLLDLVPQVFVDPVIEKLRFIHNLNSV